jgi:hypothetical protein
MLISRFRPATPSVSSSMTFQILTTLSIPPVTMHPRMWGLTSSAEAAPSCADRVYFGCAVEMPLEAEEGRVRESYARMRPFSRDT